jgi:hypothetical protein
MCGKILRKCIFFKECIVKGHPCTFRMLLTTNEPFHSIHLHAVAAVSYGD